MKVRTPASLLVVALLGVAAGSCGDDPSSPGETPEPARLKARPSPPGDPLSPGVHPLEQNPGFFYLPAGLEPGEATPLVVLLHGAGGGPGDWSGALSLADSAGIALLVPESRGSTWDAVRGDFGPDVAALDAALEEVFDHANVDPARLALGGFSDGASYALSLGLVNGDLFSHLLAFSPGFIRSPSRSGRPRIRITHGTRDQVLPVQGTRSVIVPALREAGYDVVYQEFDGGHTLPAELAVRAFEWVLEGG